jgi:hypothetical protein
VALLYIFLCILVGIALDWAIYIRLIYIIGRPGFFGEGDEYRTFLFPRIAVTILAVLVMFFSGSMEGTNSALFLAGVGMFLSSTCYALYRYFQIR